MDFEKFKNPAEENKNKSESEKSEEKDAEKNPEEREEEKEKSEVTDKEDYIETNKEQIKEAAENWIISNEEQLLINEEKRLKIFANIGRFAGVYITSVELRPGGDPLQVIAALAIVYGAAFAVGGLAGKISGKIYNYFERRKFNKQKKEVEQAIGRPVVREKPATFKEVKSSLDNLKE